MKVLQGYGLVSLLTAAENIEVAVRAAGMPARDAQAVAAAGPEDVGLGAEFARQLAPHASSLILVARRLERLEAIKEELDRPGLTIHCHAADVADEVQIGALLAALAASGERVSLLINNAGVGDHGLF